MPQKALVGLHDASVESPEGSTEASREASRSAEPPIVAQLSPEKSREELKEELKLEVLEEIKMELAAASPSARRRFSRGGDEANGRHRSRSRGRPRRSNPFEVFGLPATPTRRPPPPGLAPVNPPPPAMPANIPTEFAGLFAVSNASSMRLTREEMQAVRNTLTSPGLVQASAGLGETFNIDAMLENAKRAKEGDEAGGSPRGGCLGVANMCSVVGKHGEAGLFMGESAIDRASDARLSI